MKTNGNTKSLASYIHLYIGCEIVIPSIDEELENWEGYTLSGVCFKEATIYHSEHGISQFHVDDIKLLLRPLSDMTEDEAVEFIHLKNRSIMCNIDRTHITKVSFGSTKNVINFSYFKQVGSGAEAGSKTYYVNQSDAEQFMWLLKNSFDLFRLIDAGLAINANTQNQTN